MKENTTMYKHIKIGAKKYSYTQFQCLSLALPTLHTYDICYT